MFNYPLNTSFCQNLEHLKNSSFNRCVNVHITCGKPGGSRVIVVTLMIVGSLIAQNAK